MGAPPTTYVVAVTRWGRPWQEEAAEMAQALGGTVIDARKVLGGPVPVVVRATSDEGEASRLRARFRDRGHGVVACDLSRVASSRTMVSPRDFELGPTAFVAHLPAEGPEQMPYDEVVAIVWARHTVTEVTRSIEHGRKFSAGRAVMTSGLIRSVATVTKKISETEEHEGVVYLYRKTGAGHFLLREGSLRYGGLGDGRAPTRTQNFKVLVDALRQRAPSALFDARLATSPPRKALAPSATGLPATSNVDATDLAAHLVTIARLQGQI